MDNKAPQSFSNEIQQYLELFRHWAWLLILFTILGSVGTYFFSIRQEKIYQASATVLIDQPQVSTDYTTSLSNDRMAQTYSQLMVQQPTLEGVIQRLGIEMSVDELAKALKVSAVPDTQLLRITIEDTDPQQAAQIVNTIGIVFAEENDAFQAARYLETKSSLQAQMSTMDQQIEETSRALDAIKNAVEVDTQGNILDVQLTTYREIYQDLLKQIVELESQPAVIDAPVSDQPQDLAAPSSPIDQRLATLEARITEISAQMDELGSWTIEYKLLNTKLSVYQSLYTQLVQEVAKTDLGTTTESGSDGVDVLTFSSLTPDVETLSAQLEVTGERIQEITDQINASGGSSNGGVERDRLESNLALYRQTYANLVQSYEQVRLAEIQNTTRVDLVQPATPPVKPIRPDVVQNTLLGAVVGLIIGGSLAFLIEMLDDTVKGPEDVLRNLGLPILGYVSHIEASGEDLITIREPRSPISEAFRSIRTNIQHSSIDRPLQSIMVTSPTPRDGKSTVAANLGVVFAHGQFDVTIVDGDMRRPRQHKLFNLPNRKGLTETLAWTQTEINLNGNFQKKEGLDKLSIMTTGALPPNPSEIIGSDRMLAFIHQMKGKSNILIVDTPPVIAVTDPVILSTRVDGVILVLRPGVTKMAAAIQATEQLQQVGANILGVILNDSEKKANRYYHYYKGYYYQYGKYYEYSSDGEKKRRTLWSGNSRS